MTRNRAHQISVVGNAQAGAEALDLAERAGNTLGRLAPTIITGGGGGVMEAVCRGAKRAGATTVGILPGDSLEAGNPYLDITIPSGIGFARNMTNVLAADVVVCIGGAAGTLSEIAYAWMHGKPIVALTGAGGWSDRLAGTPLDGRRGDFVHAVATTEELEHVVAHLLGEPPRRGRVMSDLG